MDYLKTQTDTYRDATQKDPKAKRELIHVFMQICELSAMIERDVKDKASFDALYEKCASSNNKMVKELNSLAANLSSCKKALDVVKHDRKERNKKKKTPPAVPPMAAPTNTIVLTGGGDEDPVAPKLTKVPKAPKKPATGGKKKISKETREQIWEHYIGDRAKAECPVCRKRTIRMTDFSAGHIVAEACGGATDATNLMPICSNCNSRMSTMNLYEYCQKEFGRAPDFGTSDGKV